MTRGSAPSSLQMVTRLVVLLALSPLAGCGARTTPPHETPREGPTDPAPSADSPDSLGAIEAPAQWSALAYRPPDATVARTEVVKVVVDLEADWRLYFLQSERWPLHFHFVQRFIDPQADHETFNVREYRRVDRRFVLASLVHYLDADVWSLELVAGDTLDQARMGQLFGLVRDRVFFGAQLRLRPLAEGQRERATAAAIPLVDEEALQAAMRYQPLVPGVAFGYLRLLHDPASLTDAGPQEVVVTGAVPEDLPPVAGLITERLLAPLAHVAVLSRSRGTPAMALRGALTDPRLTALDGQLVRLSVGAQELSVRRATVAEAQPLWDRRRPAEAYLPPIRQPTPVVLVPMAQLTLGDADVVGAKAAQLAEIGGLSGVETPGGFAVPFGGFLDHRAAAGVDAPAIARVAALDDRAQRRAALAALREAIETHPVDPALIRRVRAALVPGRRHIFRSSTNAEDLVGFSGAGLYRSVVVDARPSERAIADALRAVWASVFSDRAWEERAWARIEQPSVAMGVLVQPFVDGIAASGVAVTANPFTETRPGVFINLQTRAEGVTAGEGDELPEQVLVYTWTPDPEAHVLGRSTRTGGAPILREGEAERLTTLLQTLHAHLVPTWGPPANAVDVEVLLTDDRRFVIVQGRPITIRYGAGQTW